ncbi:MAG: universal stress protein [Alphaproteobacteria bacterium]|uniref:Universal stress protein n=1 Tax=Candidatus Nitrobium versatile TaxID=2884831 RepID=A0A953JAV9_9BACT|nr:universal stress protein [Candidatus Nitrobium versatile]
MKGYRKILIALDGTSREGVAKGLRLAKEERCWITVVKVVPPHEGDLDLVGVRNIDAVLDGGGAGHCTCRGGFDQNAPGSG